MKIIITGGTGFIGQALARNLAQDNHEVIILTRNPHRYAQAEETNPKYIAWDGRSSQGWSKWVNRADAIVNLAGESIGGENFVQLITKRWRKKQKDKILVSRVNAGRAIVEAVKSVEYKPNVIIQSSAVGYYGNRGDEELTEEANQGSDFLADVCGRWEESTAALEQIGLRRVIIRTAGMVLGREGGSLPYMTLPYKYFMGGPLGSGQQWMSWIHLADEVNAIKYFLAKSDTAGVYNLCAPNVYRNREFSQILGQVLKRPSLLSVPTIALKLLFGEKAMILISSQRQIPTRLQKAGYSFQFPDLEEALKDIFVDSR